MEKLQQIAQTVGVSSNTVLRVLRGQNKEVWPSAVRRAEAIRSLAAELGYLPNSSARAMRRGSFDCVALLLSVDRGRSYVSDDLFNAIHDALAAEQKRLVVAKATDERLTDRNAVPAILREWCSDGLLINYTDHIPAEMVQLIDRYEIPSIWINSRRETDSVYYDDLAAAVTATEHLISLGHRSITYLDFVAADDVQAHYSRGDRYDGYAQAMRAAGLPAVPRGAHGKVKPQDRLQRIMGILSAPDRPTAILSYDAPDRVLYAAALCGLRVPQDLSVMSFATRPPRTNAETLGESFLGLACTQMRVPSEKAGTTAVEMLLQKIADPGEKLPSAVLLLEMEQGDTTGPPPGR